MNKEDNFIDELFGKTEETEAVKPQTTEIINKQVCKIQCNSKGKRRISCKGC